MPVSGGGGNSVAPILSIMNASPEHKEAILRAVSLLMQGDTVRLARLGTLSPVHHPATRSGASWMPPFSSLSFTQSDKYPEMEPPTPLDFLSRHIREQLASNGHADISGFGVFAHSGSGVIGFTAHGSLSEAVNHSFSHLESRDIPPPAAIPDAEPEFASAPEIPPVAEPILEPEPESEPEPEPVPAPEPDPETVPEPFVPVPPVSAPPEEARPAATSKSPRAIRASRNQRSPWIMAALIVIPLAIALVFWFSSREAPVETGQVAVVTPPDTSAVSNGAPDTTSVLAIAPETEPASSSDSVAFDVPVQAPSTDELRRGMDGYTLIVTSSVSLAAARDLMKDFEALSLPLGVLVYESGGSVLYRVGVGRWSSAALADSARQSLSSSLPDGTWVRRLN